MRAFKKHGENSGRDFSDELINCNKEKVLLPIWTGFLFIEIFKRHFCFCKIQNKSAEKGVEKSSGACGCGELKRGKRLFASYDEADVRPPFYQLPVSMPAAAASWTAALLNPTAEMISWLCASTRVS